jgi:glutathione S-transferase
VSLCLCESNSESRAICRYICEKYADKGNKGLYGTDPLSKASIDQWVEAEGQSFNPPSSALVFQLAFAPRMNIKQDKVAIRQNEEKLSKVLDIYEKRLGESQFLAGDEFSLADLSHLPNTQYLSATDKGKLFTSRTNVGRWWDEISTRDSWKKVVDLQKSA